MGWLWGGFWFAGGRCFSGTFDSDLVALFVVARLVGVASGVLGGFVMWWVSWVVAFVRVWYDIASYGLSCLWVSVWWVW